MYDMTGTLLNGDGQERVNEYPILCVYQLTKAYRGKGAAECVRVLVPVHAWESRSVLRIRDPGSSAFLTPGSGMGKKSGSGSGMNNPDHIS